VTESISLDRVAEATEELITLFESGDLPQAIFPLLWTAGRAARPSDAWSLGNRLIMVLVGKTNDARGYRQWAEVGRHVKKGAKAFYILGPMTKTITVHNEETGEDEKRTVVFGFKAIPVFRYEDTEGEPLPEPDPAPFAIRPLPLEAVARAWGYEIEYGPSEQGEFGYQVGNRIHLSTDDPLTFFHELAHAADARNHELRGGQHPDQEIVAETVAALLARAHGQPLEKLAFSRLYLEGYAKAAKKSLPAAIMGLLSRIEEAVHEILTTAAELDAQQTAQQAAVA
jgi:hypothetical protein